MEPKRTFDPMLRLQSVGEQDFPEDHELTEFLTRELGDLYSLSETPPQCPRCESLTTVLFSRPAVPKPIIPVFLCEGCGKHFRRTTGTPLSGSKFSNMPLLIRLLSQQRTFTDAARLLKVKPLTVTNWTNRIRTWLLQIDTSGYWESKIRLGMEISPKVSCPRCASVSVRYRGFNADHSDRNCMCQECGRYFLLSSAMHLQAIAQLDHVVRQRPPSPRKKTHPA